MKYIRTETGIIEVSKLLEENDSDINFYLKSITKKEADNIYDLCDYAIIQVPYDKLPDIKKLSEMDKKGELHNPPVKYIDNLKFIKVEKKWVEYIKFAILTDKGLTVVAEMNDKGELELL